MRGTFDSSHSWSVSMHAAISGSAEFLFPSTVTFPDSRRPPSILSFAIRSSDPFPEIHDLFSQHHAELRRHFRLASIDQRTDVLRRRAPFVHDEIGMRRRHGGRTLSRPFQAGAIDERASRGRNAVWHPFT